MNIGVTIVSTPPPAGTVIGRRMGRLGLTADDLAMRTGWPAELVRGVLSGKERLTAELAVQIEEAIGISAVTIMHADAEHRVWHVRVVRGGQRR